MRQIVLDTETTGLEPGQGHRIIEIGAVEMVHRRRTDKHLHLYLNPQREVDEAAYEIHGLSNEFLADKPRFADIAQDFIDFIRDGELIIHNAPFDVAFMNAELARLGAAWGRIEDYCTITDSLTMARKAHPGQRNTLDALCGRYEIDNSARDLHGALLDAQILVDVYLALTREQTSLGLDAEEVTAATIDRAHKALDRAGTALKLIQPNREELQAHEQRLDAIERESGGRCLWRQADTGAA